MEKIILNLVSIILSPFTKSFLKKFEKNDLINKTVNLYPNKTFIKIRFWDAPFIEVEKLIPREGKILDLGCGEGIFTNYLALSSRKRKIIGVELDKARIKEADKGLKNAIFINVDATKKELPNVDTVIMFHLLHHLTSYREQEELIKDVAKKITAGGKLIIVEVEIEFSYKYFLAWITDHFIVPWLFEKRLYSPVYLRNSSSWKQLVESMGFSCTIKKAEKGKPFSHVILVCIKKN